MLRKVVRWLPVVLVGLVVAIQLVPYGRDHSNPPVEKEPAWDSPATRALVARACFDCHSNETVWPWYSHIAPFSWSVQDHVEEGREHLNFSEWAHPSNRQLEHAHEAAEEVEEGAMPLSSYVRMHPEARLSDEEREALIAGLQATFKPAGS